MKQIENYEQFCKAFYSEDENLKKDAKLLLFIQDWIIRVLDFIEEDTLDYSLNKLIDQKSDKRTNKSIPKDALSNIVNNSEIAFKHLTENMREKIIRENIQMPVYKVREINSYGLNWLSRQSGKTIRQKISSAGNSIMAVQRRMSLDTAENRLFIAFAKEILEHLNVKLKYIPEEKIRKKELDLRDEISSFLRRTDIEEIKIWENLPPNNTLLSDQSYKKIWYAWNEIKKLDELIKNDVDLLGNRLATIFFIEALVYSRHVLKIPQQPVEVEYDDYNVYLCDQNVHCLDLSGKSVEFKKKDNNILVSSPKGEVKVEFLGKRLIIYVNNEKNNEYEISQDTFFSYIRLVLSKAGIKVVKGDTKKFNQSVRKYKSVVVDLFSLHPGYIADEEGYDKLSERILQQKYSGVDIDGEEKKYYIPCDTTNAINMVSGITETYTIPFAVDNGSMEQMKRLMHMMENYIITDSFTYVFPDVYNELQMSMIHKATRMVYSKVRNVPLSIAAAFNYQTTADFRKNFNIGDYLLVLNWIDDELTFTLVASKYDPSIENDIPEYKGVFWERYPTSTMLLKGSIEDNIIDKMTKLGCAKPKKLYKLLGLNGLKEETDRLSVFFGEEWYEFNYETKEMVENYKVNVTDIISEFLTKNRSIVKGAKIHILSVIDNLVYKGLLPYKNIDNQSILEGCKYLETLEYRTKIPLWHDHLPALAIKLMYGKFDLIKNARVEPRFEKKQIIPINSTFTLPKKCQEYHFNLVQDENARKMQYEAVIKNPAFPLSQDIECDLVMTYQYGAEEPYQLIFVPKDKKQARFSEAKVNWSRLEKYPTYNLKAPEFPAKLTWDELSHYPGRKGEVIDVCKELEKEFELLNEGYHTCDISNTFMRKNNKNEWRGEFSYQKNNKKIRVHWEEKDWDRYSQIPSDISNISFWLLPKVNKDKSPKRYYIHDLFAARTRDKLWFINKMGRYQCIVNMEYEGEMTTISLIDQKFDIPENFHLGINNVSFEVRSNNGRLQADNIHDEDGEEPPKRYNAINICEGSRIPVPPRFFINAYHGKWTRALFANNRSLSEEGCPQEFQKSFVKSVGNWVNLFYQYRSANDKKEIFTLLSLAAQDIGSEYYNMAYVLLDMYRDGKIDIPYEIGCAFCDLSNDMQKKLLESVLTEVVEDYKVIGILAKAIWHNEQFIFNIDSDLVLNVYLPKAINYIGSVIYSSKSKRKLRDYLENIKYCLEFILGVLRLRSLNEVTNQYLSLNNLKMQELYKYLEFMVDNNIKIHSFLKLEISTKGIYNKICDLLYVLLVYVTGYNTEGEIRISGINIDDDETRNKSLN